MRPLYDLNALLDALDERLTAGAKAIYLRSLGATAPSKSTQEGQSHA